MPKITEYPEAQSFDAGDVILKDGAGGTKKMTVETLKTLIAPEVDTTLTQEGQAAEAKAVGENIVKLNGVITMYGLSDRSVQKDLIIQGTYNSQGAVVANANRIRTQGMLQVENGQVIRFAAGTNVKSIFLGAFDTSKTFIRDGTWITSDSDIPINWDGYVIIVFRGITTTTPIAPADYDAQTTIISKQTLSFEDARKKIDNCVELPYIFEPVEFTEAIGMINRNDLTILNGDNPTYIGRYTSIPVQAGEVYKISGYSQNNNYPCAFGIKQNGTTAMTPLLLSGYGVTYTDAEITIPNEMATLYVNGMNGDGTRIGIKKRARETQENYEASINGIEERVNELYPEVPSYWQTDLDTKIPQIIENMGDAGTNGETFVFLTDAHWATNYKKSPALVKEIIRRTNINKIILGGDNIIIQDSKADAMNEGLEVIKAFSGTGARLYNTFGNHEANIQFSNSAVVTSKHLNYGEVYASQFKEMDDYGITYLNPDVDFSYYFDNAIQKTRFIVLDSGEGFLPSGTTDPDNVIRQDFSSYEELHDVLMATTAGWKVIVICHILTNKPFPNIYSLLEGNNKKATANIYDGETVVGTYDFANAPATVVIAIGGHAHYDKYGGTENTRYVPWVITDCDCWDIKKVYTDEGGNTIDRTGQVVEGTTTEQAFDVVTIDYGNNVAHFVRIGTRGSNRDISLKLA